MSINLWVSSPRLRRGCAAATIHALAADGTAMTLRRLASVTGYGINSISHVARLITMAQLAEPADVPQPGPGPRLLAWRVTDSGRVFAATLPPPVPRGSGGEGR